MPSPIMPLPAGASLPQLVSMINQNFASIGVTERTTIYNDSNGVPSIIIGILPDGTNGIVIAKPGVNVLTLFQ